MTLQKTLLTITMIALLAPTTAMASDIADNTANFVVKTTTDGNIKRSVKAFNQGEFERSIAYSKKALDSGLSKRRKAIAQSNLCAALAVTGNMDAANAACTDALALRPDYEPAQLNKSALTIMLAQK